MNEKINNEVRLAYADCHMEDGMAERNLNFRASEVVTRDEAIDIMGRWIAGGYNEFKAKLLRNLPTEAMVTIARECSVCIYVTIPGGVALTEDIADAMKADEFSETDGEYRLWWD